MLYIVIIFLLRISTILHKCKSLDTYAITKENASNKYDSQLPLAPANGKKTQTSQVKERNVKKLFLLS